MIYEKHLRVRPHRTLCGRAIYRVNSTGERLWVTCPYCRDIITSHHPGVNPDTLFALSQHT